ncbi:nuclear transcription factor Y subunit beta [Entamoeba marina]
MLNTNTSFNENDTTLTEQTQINNAQQADLTLPLANTTRVMREAIAKEPGDVRISKDAQQYMTELATEFILFISSEAASLSSSTLKPKHTLSGKDMIDALKKLGFEEYAPCLERHLQRYQAMDGQEETNIRKRVSSDLPLLAQDKEPYMNQHQPPHM